jgi:hypothetical protein
MVIEDIFKSLVDKVHGPSFSADVKKDVRKLYSHYELSTDGSAKLSDVAEFLHKRIRSILITTGKELTWYDLKALNNQLIRRHIVEGCCLEPYLDIIQVLLDEIRTVAVGQTFHSFAHESEWVRVLQDIKDLFELGQAYGVEDVHAMFPRIARTADKIRWLRNAGFSGISIKDGKFDITSDGLLTLVNSIEQDIKEMGGVDIAEKALLAIAQCYDKKQARYHLGRKCNTTGQQVSPQLPVGYLLNLCVKSENWFTKGNITKDKLDILCNKLVALGCRYDVQPYSTFELEFKTSRNIVGFLQEISIYDSLFTMKQQRSTDVCKIIEGLFDWVNDVTMQKAFGCTMEQLLEIISVILAIPLSQKTAFFSDDFICKKISNVKENTVVDVLEILTHKSPGPNQSFSKPNDMREVDFWFKPLLRSDKKWCVLDASLCGGAFYESIAAILRKITNTVDDEIGYAAERFIKAELDKRNIKNVSGKYKCLGKDRECDIVIDTADTIFFIEIKKKPLTRNAQSGSDISLLVDVSKSLIDSQIQLGNHEILIRGNGSLKLEDSPGSYYQLKLNKRNVERISLTVSDYGGIQDRRVISQLLAIMQNIELSSIDTKYQKDIKDLNDKCRELNKQTLELKSLNALGLIPYFNCWFLSIPQFLVLLDDVNSGEDLKKKMFHLRSCTFGSLDFYFELACMDKLHSVKKS